MTQNVNILQHMDDESIRWQICAICGQQKQRIVHQMNRPDFAVCDNCHSAFVLEEGGGMRMLYGKIPDELPETRQFALKQWRRYFDIRAVAERERGGAKDDDLPEELRRTLETQTPVDPQTAILELEAKQSDIFYSRAKKLEEPPRRLRETGELPNLDDLFKDPK
jgi:hypothetical protein